MKLQVCIFTAGLRLYYYVDAFGKFVLLAFMKDCAEALAEKSQFKGQLLVSHSLYEF